MVEVEKFDPIISHSATLSRHPGGSKGMEESASICGYAAIANAVEDAINSPNYKINETYLPPERLFDGMRKMKLNA